MESEWDTKDTIALRVIQNMKDPYGQPEQSLASKSAVETDAKRTLQQIGTPEEYSPEVNDPNSGWDIPYPRMKLAPPPVLKSDAESKEHLAAFHQYLITATIERKPNRWDVNGSINVFAPGVVTTDGLQNIWQPKIGRTLVTVRNTGSNPVYVAPSQDKLRGGSTRGLSIAAGDTYDFETEGGGWAYSPLGTVIDVIDFWYEDGESRPPRFEES